MITIKIKGCNNECTIKVKDGVRFVVMKIEYPFYDQYHIRSSTGIVADSTYRFDVIQFLIQQDVV